MGKGSRPRPFSVSQNEFGNNFDNIFRKKDMTPRVEENTEEIGKCGCGRSPTGKCIGWHGLSEEEYRDALAKYEDDQNKQAQNQ